MRKFGNQWTKIARDYVKTRTRTSVAQRGKSLSLTLKEFNETSSK